jgi:competence protein ComEA
LTGRRLFVIGVVLGLLIGAGIARQFAGGDELVVRVEPVATPSTVVVYVSGAVDRPGLYEVASEARVGHVVELAGPSAEADLGRVPMAERVRDGQTITVPSIVSLAAAATGGAGSREATAAPVAEETRPIDVNRATAAELERLPGVGPALAQRIVAYREAHGPFRSVEELAMVPGISERMVTAWGDLVTVGSSE